MVEAKEMKVDPDGIGATSTGKKTVPPRRGLDSKPQKNNRNKAPVLVCLLVSLSIMLLVKESRTIRSYQQHTLQSGILNQQEASSTIRSLPTDNNSKPLVPILNRTRGPTVSSSRASTTMPSRPPTADKNKTPVPTIHQHNKTAGTVTKPKPKPQQTSFFDARSPDGNFGYVADPTLLKRGRLEFLQKQQHQHGNVSSENDAFFTALEHYASQYRNGTWSGETRLDAEELCLEPGQGLDKGGFELLNKKLQVANVTTAERSTPRILCSIYTFAKNRDLARTAALTWGYKCDGWLAFSTETIPELGMIDLVHPGEESYKNMWQKSRSIWAYIHKHYLSDYDYFHLGGDDHFVIVENLRQFLMLVDQKTQPDKKPAFLGAWAGQIGQKRPPPVMGGPGYTFNRAALKLVGEKVTPFCMTGTIKHSEDKIMTDCLHLTSRLGPMDTRDVETGEQQYVRITTSGLGERRILTSSRLLE
jgi:hypothetical protein